jgi:hypothetical protein
MAEFLCLTRFLFFYSLYAFSSYEEGAPFGWFHAAR